MGRGWDRSQLVPLPLYQHRASYVHIRATGVFASFSTIFLVLKLEAFSQKDTTTISGM